MKIYVILLCLMLFIALLTRNASAQSSGSNYDWRSGNSYTWNKGPDGTTNLQGFNLRSGTHWNTTIQPNGNMHGFDGGNHYWTYQQGSGYYHNFGTGDTCIGQGYARHCY